MNGDIDAELDAAAAAAFGGVPPLADDWPAPPADAAYHGIAGEYVHAIAPHTEADPVAILVQLLVGFGNMVGRGPYFEIEASRHHPNLFAVLIGRTSRGRKGTAWNHAHRLLESVDPIWAGERIQCGAASGEAIIAAVRDARADDPGVEDKRLLLFESEFGRDLRVMRRETNILGSVLRQAWDSGSIRNLTKHDPHAATGAHVSMIGHITAAELKRLLGHEEIFGGTTGRILWVAVKRQRLLPFGGGAREVNVAPYVLRLRKAVDAARRIDAMLFSEEAARLWATEYERLAREEDTDVVGAVLSRAEAQTLRLAITYALLDSAATIGSEHLRAALAVWDYCVRSARFIFGSDPLTIEGRRILGGVQRRGGLSRSEIIALFHGHKTAREIDEYVEDLVRRGLAFWDREEGTGGRPREVLRPSRTCEESENTPLSSLFSQDEEAFSADDGYVEEDTVVEGLP